MVKVFVAQTQKKDRDLVCDSLTASGQDAEPHATDPLSRVWLIRKMSFMTEPFALVASQRDDYGCEYVSNLLHGVAFNLHVPTLTIVYSRAVGHQEHMPGVIKFLSDLRDFPTRQLEILSELEIENAKKHKLKMIPKFAEDTRTAEQETILAYINDFVQEPH
jgi:hypothetical protein